MTPERQTLRLNSTLFVRTLYGKWEIVSLHGKTEVYREYPDAPGVRAFLGYVEDHVLHFLPSPDAKEALEALAFHEAA